MLLLMCAVLRLLLLLLLLVLLMMLLCNFDAAPAADGSVMVLTRIYHEDHYTGITDLSDPSRWWFNCE